MDNLNCNEYAEIPRPSIKEEVKFDRPVRLPSDIFWRLTRILNGRNKDEDEDPKKRKIARKTVITYLAVILIVVVISVIVMTIAITQITKRPTFEKEIVIGGEDEQSVIDTSPPQFLWPTKDSNLPPPPDLNEGGPKGKVQDLFNIQGPDGNNLELEGFDVSTATVELGPAYDFRQGVAEFTADGQSTFLCYDNIVDIEKDNIAKAICGSLPSVTSTPAGARLYGEPVVLTDTVKDAVLSCPTGASTLFYCVSPTGVSSCTEKVAVICHQEAPLPRLISGEAPGSGVVQMYLNGTWGYVCPGPQTGAETICDYLGHRPRFAKLQHKSKREVEIPEMPRHYVQINCPQVVLAQPGDFINDCSFDTVYDHSQCDDNYLYLQCEPAAPLPDNFYLTPNNILLLKAPTTFSNPGCSFEEGLPPCGWTQSTDDQLDWSVVCQKDQTENTGPLSGVGPIKTGRCYLMFDSNIRTTAGRANRLGDTAVVVTPAVDLTDKCISFNYNTFGDSVDATFTVEQVLEDGSAEILHSETTTETFTDRGWKFMSLASTADEVSKIKFTASVGFGPRGNIAIDEVDISEEACNYLPDSDTCRQGYKHYSGVSGTYCVPYESVCNNYHENAPNLYGDEENCVPGVENVFQCYNGTYIPSYYACDGTLNCLQGEDEEECSSCTGEHQFLCANNACVHTSFKCDGLNQCGDWSDESDCVGGCPEFVCETEGYCLPFKHRCDWTKQCASGDDQVGCTWQCDFENGDACLHRMTENIELSTTAKIPLTVNSLESTNTALKSSEQGQFGYFVTPVVNVPTLSCLTFKHQGIGNTQAAVYIQITINDQTKLDWFSVAPSNNTWNTSKIEIFVPNNEARIRATFGLWDTYLDDIDLALEKCTSTPSNRARNPQGVLYPVNSFRTAGEICSFDEDDCNFFTYGFQRITVAADRLELVGGTKAVGRLELDVDGAKVSFCRDGWNDYRATVVCRSKGYSRGVMRGGYEFPGSTAQPLINTMYCPDNYISLFQCVFDGFYSNTCSNDQRVTIQCADYFYSSEAEAVSDTSYLSTDGTAAVSFMYTSVDLSDSGGPEMEGSNPLVPVSSSTSVRFSYRMPQGYWIYVFGMCDEDFNPFTFKLFSAPGAVFTKTTSVGQWEHVEENLACVDKVFIAAKTDSASSIQITNITFSATAATETLTCTDEELTCDTAKQCYPLLKKCDGEHDCLDGSDEKNCTQAICDDYGPVPPKYRSCQEFTVGGNDTNVNCLKPCQPGPDPDGKDATWCETENGWGRCVADAVATTGGTSHGAICHFPFYYRGTWYNKCTRAGHNQPWCSVTSHYWPARLWGNCGGCPAVGCLRATDRGPGVCKIPFTYRGMTYYSCTTKDHPQPWCFMEDGNWGNCKECANSPCRERTKGGTMRGRRCHSPFIYRGKPYNSCTKTDNNNVHWCAGTENYDQDPQKRWGNCRGCPELEPCWHTTIGGTSGGAMCTIPFEYKGEIYYDCTNKDHKNYNGLWCGTTDNYGTAEAWGNCAECVATPYLRHPVCLGNFKSFNDLTLEGGTVVANNLVSWTATTGDDVALYRCPRISADRFTPVADLKIVLEDNLGRKADAYAPDTSAGGYLYADWSNEDVTVGYKSSITFQFNIKMTCFHFCYYLSGRDVGSLNVYANSRLVWAVRGHQGDEWHCSQIQFGGFAGSLRFEAVKGAGDNLGTCIAIDQISAKEKCERPAFAAKNCPDNTFNCGQGHCIPASQRCDCIRQCYNNADEAGCRSCTPPPPPREPAHPLTSRTRKCPMSEENILPEESCDGVAHCASADDETECECPADGLVCDGYCITSNKLCDGIYHCSQQQDEKCIPGCPLDHFKCDNGECVPIAAFCDGTKHCKDGSDEQVTVCSKPCKVDISGLPGIYSLSEPAPSTLGYCQQYTLKISCDGKLWSKDTSYDMHRHLVLECKVPGETLTVSTPPDLKCLPGPPANGKFFPYGPAHYTDPVPMDAFGDNYFAEIPLRFTDGLVLKGRQYQSIYVSQNGFVRFGHRDDITTLEKPICFKFMTQDNFPYDGLFSLLSIRLSDLGNDDALIYIDEFDGLEYSDPSLEILNDEANKLNTMLFPESGKFNVAYALIVTYQNIKDVFLNVYNAQLAFIQNSDGRMFVVWNYDTHPGILENDCQLGALIRTADYMLINDIASSGNLLTSSNYDEPGRYAIEAGHHDTYYLPPNTVQVLGDPLSREEDELTSINIGSTLGPQKFFGYSMTHIGVNHNGYTVMGTDDSAFPTESCLDSFVPVDVAPVAYAMPVNIELNYRVSPGKIYFGSTSDLDNPAISELKAEVCEHDAAACVGWNPSELIVVTFQGMKPNYEDIDTAMTFQLALLRDDTKAYAIFIYGLILEYLPGEYCDRPLKDGVVVNGDKIRTLDAPSYWERQFTTNALTPGRWVVNASGYNCIVPNTNVGGFVVSTPLPYEIPVGETAPVNFDCVNGSPFDVVNGHSSSGGQRLNPRMADCPVEDQGGEVNVTSLLEGFECIAPLVPCCSEFGSRPETLFDDGGITSGPLTTPLHAGLRVKEKFWNRMYFGKTGFAYLHSEKIRESPTCYSHVSPEMDQATHSFSLFSLQFDTPYLYIDELVSARSDLEDEVLEKLSAKACAYWDSVEDVPCGFSGTYGVMLTSIRSELDGNEYTGQLAFVSDGGETFVMWSYVDYTPYGTDECEEAFGMASATADIFDITALYPDVLTMSNFGSPGQMMIRVGQYKTDYHPPNMFPYGEEAGDTIIEYRYSNGIFADADQHEITLSSDLHVFDFVNDRLSVSSEGYINVATGPDSGPFDTSNCLTSSDFDPNAGVYLLQYNTDLNPNISPGWMAYRITIDETTLQNITDKVCKAFDCDGWEPREAAIITHHGIAVQDDTLTGAEIFQHKSLTFQSIIATNGTATYGITIYGLITDYNLPCYEFIGVRLPSGLSKTWLSLDSTDIRDDYFNLQFTSNINEPGVHVEKYDGLPCQYQSVSSPIFKMVPSDEDITEIECEDSFTAEFFCDPEGTPFDMAQGSAENGRPLSPRTAWCNAANQGQILDFGININEWTCLTQLYISGTELDSSFADQLSPGWQNVSLSNSYPIKGKSYSSYQWAPIDGMVIFGDRKPEEAELSATCARQLYSSDLDRFDASFHLANKPLNTSSGIIFTNEYSSTGTLNEQRALELMTRDACYLYETEHDPDGNGCSFVGTQAFSLTYIGKEVQVEAGGGFTAQLTGVSDGLDTYMMFSYNTYEPTPECGEKIGLWAYTTDYHVINEEYEGDLVGNTNINVTGRYGFRVGRQETYYLPENFLRRGEEYGDTYFRKTDQWGHVFELDPPLNVFDYQFTGVFTNGNGSLQFGFPSSRYFGWSCIPTPITRPHGMLVAYGFQGQLTSLTYEGYYRYTNDETDLAWIEARVEESGVDASWDPIYALVVTINGIKSDGEDPLVDPLLGYQHQLIVASDNFTTYGIVNYGPTYFENTNKMCRRLVGAAVNGDLMRTLVNDELTPRPRDLYYAPFSKSGTAGGVFPSEHYVVLLDGFPCDVNKTLPDPFSFEDIDAIPNSLESLEEVLHNITCPTTVFDFVEGYTTSGRGTFNPHNVTCSADVQGTTRWFEINPEYHCFRSLHKCCDGGQNAAITFEGDNFTSVSLSTGLPFLDGIDVKGTIRHTVYVGKHGIVTFTDPGDTNCPVCLNPDQPDDIFLKETFRVFVDTLNYDPYGGVFVQQYGTADEAIINDMSADVRRYIDASHPGSSTFSGNYAFSVTYIGMTPSHSTTRLVGQASFITDASDAYVILAYDAFDLPADTPICSHQVGAFLQKNEYLDVTAVSDGDPTSGSNCGFTGRYVFPIAHKRRMILADGPYSWWGRPEYLHNGEWGTFNTDGFTDNEANVICNELGYSTGKAVTAFTVPGSSGKTCLVNSLTCTGIESSFTQCSTVDFSSQAICDHGTFDAGVACTGPVGTIQLSPGPHLWAGVLKVYNGGAWVTACADGWTDSNTEVVCQMLNAEPVAWYAGNWYGATMEAMAMYDVKCSGSESKIQDCYFKTESTTCSSGAVSIKCEEQVRLEDGPRSYLGRVEMHLYHSDIWVSVQDSGHSLTSKVCGSLGLPEGGWDQRISTMYCMSSGTYGAALDTSMCTNDHPLACLTNSGTALGVAPEQAGVDCFPRILLNEETGGYARVFYSNNIGGICFDSVDDTAADVICKYRGFLGGIKSDPVLQSIPPGDGVVFGSLACTGTEKDITECINAPSGVNNAQCSSNSYTGVVCQFQDPPYAIRLFASERDNTMIPGKMGFPQIYIENSWGFLCLGDTYIFEQNEVDTVCLNLGFQSGSVLSTKPYIPCGFPFWADEISCTATDKIFRDCTKNGPLDHNCVNDEMVYIKCYDNYLGCWGDTNPNGQGTTFTEAMPTFDGTIEGCISSCRTAGYKYAGLKKGDQCSCGNGGYDTVGRCPSQGCACDKPCDDASRMCGGARALSLYLAVDLSTGLYNCFSQENNKKPMADVSYTTGSLTIQECQSHCDKVDTCTTFAWNSNPRTCNIYTVANPTTETAFGFTTYKKSSCTPP